MNNLSFSYFFVIGLLIMLIVVVTVYYRNQKLNREGLKRFGTLAEKNLYPPYNPMTMGNTDTKINQDQMYGKKDKGYTIPEINIDGVGNVRVCCNQTARLHEQYCQCGMVITQKLLDYYHPL